VVGPVAGLVADTATRAVAGRVARAVAWGVSRAVTGRVARAISRVVPGAGAQVDWEDVVGDQVTGGGVPRVVDLDRVAYRDAIEHVGIGGERHVAVAR